MSGAEEIRLDTRQGRLAGLTWRRDGAPRVLALHGWLDNAASFMPLARMLGRLDLVALDLPGHGHSEHRHTSTRYHFIDYLFNIDAALEALNWPDCHLIGHSMGAAIAATYGAGAPERARSLVLLDGLGPMTASTDSTTDRLRRSLQKSRHGRKDARQYESLEAMVEVWREASGLSEANARLICRRAARQQDQHFVWRSDPALNWVSSLMMAEEQVLDLLQHIECPVLAYQATPESPWISPEKIAGRKSAIAHGEHLTIEGNHHFHMDEPAAIAETIQSFIVSNDQPTRPDQGHD